METTGLTPEKSLQIINEAIEKSRKDFEKNAGSPMIIWGSVVFIFSIAVWVMLTLTGNLNWNFLWFGIPVIGFPLTSILLKGKCKEGGESFISKTLGQIWAAYGPVSSVRLHRSTVHRLYNHRSPRIRSRNDRICAEKLLDYSRRIHNRTRLYHRPFLLSK